MRRGRALRQVARDAGVSLSTVQLWVGRAQRRRLDEVDWADRSSRPARTVSATDPDAAWAVKWGRAGFAYFDNYLIDNASRVILGVEATPARFRQEALAARRMREQVEPLGLHPESLGAEKAYGSGEFLAWLLARGVAPHVPVIDRRHQTGGRFTREQFRYAPEENVYDCPAGQPLRYRRAHPTGQGDIYSATVWQCRGGPQKHGCTPGAFRKLFVHWEEPARERVRALLDTPDYERSGRDWCRQAQEAAVGLGQRGSTV